jgi:chromosome segregation ATPase
MLNINDLKNILSSNKEIEKAFNDLMIALYENARREQKAYIEELEEENASLKTYESIIEEENERLNEENETLNKSVKDLEEENETLKEDTENIKSELEDIAGLIEDISDKIGWIL